MSAHTPPGWPAVVPPPGTPDWEQAAAEWLLDLCPADFRGYPVLRRHPLALAWLAGRTVDAARQAMATALSRGRAELTESLQPPVVDQVLQTVEREQARLLAAARGVTLIEQSLRGHRHVPRM
ncbi:MAG TPA: hypothetical protein VLL08_17265 [Kineosporiaceae bacterium]|nr:hypothetical protein [Kineosporiaceae bacterium]